MDNIIGYQIPDRRMQITKKSQMKKLRALKDVSRERRKAPIYLRSDANVRL
jgi:hypothetical protein